MKTNFEQSKLERRNLKSQSNERTREKNRKDEPEESTERTDSMIQQVKNHNVSFNQNMILFVRKQKNKLPIYSLSRLSDRPGSCQEIAREP